MQLMSPVAHQHPISRRIIIIELVRILCFYNEPSGWRRCISCICKFSIPKFDVPMHLKHAKPCTNHRWPCECVCVCVTCVKVSWSHVDQHWMARGIIIRVEKKKKNDNIIKRCIRNNTQSSIDNRFIYKRWVIAVMRAEKGYIRLDSHPKI